jgi:regulator of sigma E protease
VLVLEIIGGLLILVFLVVVHELGHAIVARRNGVVVEEFGVGFPPRAWAKKLKNGVLFTLNWLPLGGFVKLQGEHDAADQPGDYGAASFWQKTRILLAGVLINWVTAAVLLTILAWTGLPQIIPNQFAMKGDTTVQRSPVQVVSVAAKSPAEKAGLKQGDQILRVAGEPVGTADALAQATKAHAGQTVEIIYSRNATEATAKANLNKEGGSQGYLGVGSSQSSISHSTWSAPIVGVATTVQLTGATFQGVGDLLTNFAKGVVFQLSPNGAQRHEAQQSLAAAGASVSGPLGVLGVIFPAAEKAGLTQLVLLTAVISLSLSVMNALPVPALDGGRWFVMALFRLLRKPLTKAREEKIQLVGISILMLLFLAVTIADVGKFF